MSGNAMEEGLLLQIHNQSHTDPSRIGFLAGALSGFAGLVAQTVVLPALPLIFQAYLALAVAAAVGTLVTVRISAGRASRAAGKMIEKRAMMERQTERRIAAMNAASQR